MSAIMRGNVRMAISGVRGAKWRSTLTMLGVIVGIVAVVTMVGIGEGVKRQVAGQLTHFGANIVTIRPGKAAPNGSLSMDGGGAALFGLGSSAGLPTADVQTVQQTHDVAAAAPLGVAAGMVQVSGEKAVNPLVIGTNSDLPTVLNQKIKYGDFWDNTQESSSTAVIGKEAAIDLFGQPVPLGHSFTFRGQTFVVRGVFTAFNAAPFSPTADFDHAIFIPYQTAANLTQNNANVYVLLAKPDKAANIKPVIATITSRLRSMHGGQQDFSVLSPQQTEANGGAVVQLLTAWIMAVAVISLVMGGVGIMNIMLLSVTERMHEIGVRKALGATSRQILGQFVMEATVLSFIGGVIGIVVSLVVDGLLYIYTDFKPIISWRAIVVAVVTSLVVGIVFGTAPALKAARKDPIEALRHE